MSAVVSIIVPVYNVEKYLLRCVDSILEQTYRKIELILVNDGSPDGSASICDALAAQNENIRVIHKQNGGLSSARLAGFDISKGEYILFVDSDDYIEKTMVEKMVYALEKSDADMSMCGYYTQAHNVTEPHFLPFIKEEIIGREDVESRYLLPLIGRKDGEKILPGFLWIRLFKRCLIQRDFFGSERVYYKEDHVFDLLYGDNIEKISIVNEPLYHYCFNSSSLSNAYRKDKWRMYKNLYDFYMQYISDRGLIAEDRLNNYLASAVFASVDNAVMTGTLDSYRKELSVLLRDSVAQNVIREGKAASISQRVTLLLLKMKLYGVLFFFRKYRLR